MGIYSKFGILILLFTFLIFFSLYYYIIFPKLKIGKIRRIFLTFKNCEIDKLLTSTTNSIEVNKIFEGFDELFINKPLDYGYIAYDDGLLYKINKDKRKETLLYCPNNSRKHIKNIEYNLFMKRLQQGKEYDFFFFSESLIVTVKPDLKRMDFLFYFKYPSMSNLFRS